MLYSLTQACSPTRFAFPNHLSSRTESTGLGIDTAVEVRRILASWPAVIVDGDFGFHQPNRRTQGLVHDALARHYRSIVTVRGSGGVRIAEDYVRTDPRYANLVIHISVAQDASRNTF